MNMKMAKRRNMPAHHDAVTTQRLTKDMQMVARMPWRLNEGRGMQILGLFRLTCFMLRSPTASHRS